MNLIAFLFRPYLYSLYLCVSIYVCCGHFQLDLDGSHISDELLLPDDDDVSGAVNKGRKKARSVARTIYMFLERLKIANH